MIISLVHPLPKKVSSNSASAMASSSFSFSRSQATDLRVGCFPDGIPGCESVRSFPSTLVPLVRLTKTIYMVG